jgi:adenylate cyclase
MMQARTSLVLVERVADWLGRQALQENELEAIVRGCCERLAAAGMPIARVQFSFSVLHPLYRAMGFTWRRGKGLEIEGYRHVQGGRTDRFAKSPYYHILSNNLEHLRRRLDTGTELEFPILEDLRKEGLTDYLAFASEFVAGTGRGMLGSWATDQAGGFSDEEISALLRIQERLAVTCKVAVQNTLAENALSTYLGRGAGRRVLDGQIRRGDGETIKAAIVVGDMRDSTRLAEELGRQAYIDCLNVFFDHVAGAFDDAGGEILSFMGDGFLAIFPSGNSPAGRKEACRTAHASAVAAVQRMNEVNRERVKGGEREIGYGIGLHIGNVMFGNVGLEDRLSFSVFGRAVNEASRLEALTKVHKVPIIASEEFRGRCEGVWDSLGAESLRGINSPMALYSPCRSAVECDVIPLARKVRQKDRSDAEYVVLLHRGQAS